MASKGKAIDLGALQDKFTECKREYGKAKKDMEKAQNNLASTRKAYMEAQEALKQAAATVLE